MQGLLFDLDGTLFDRDTVFSAFVADQHSRFGDPLGAIPRERYIKRMVELDAHGYTPKQQAYRQLCAEEDLPDAVADRLFDDFRAHLHDHCCLFPGVEAFLEQCRERGLVLGIITNGTVRTQQRTIDRLGLARFMSAILISEHEGVRKPDQEIFQRGLQRIGCSVDTAIYVGDHPANDIAGAQRIGMKAIWKHNDYWQCSSADGTFTHYNELMSVIDRIVAGGGEDALLDELRWRE